VPLLTPTQYSRTLTAITAGLAAGTLGVQGAQGAAVYIVITLLTSLALYIKAELQPAVYFRAPVRALLLNSVFDRSTIVPFLLFWTLTYTIAHVY